MASSFITSNSSDYAYMRHNSLEDYFQEQLYHRNVKGARLSRLIITTDELDSWCQAAVTDKLITRIDLSISKTCLLELF
jgi:hypothetical protein